MANSCAQTLFYELVKDPVQPSDPCLQHLAGPAFDLP